MCVIEDEIRGIVGIKTCACTYICGKVRNKQLKMSEAKASNKPNSAKVEELLAIEVQTKEMLINP